MAESEICPHCGKNTNYAGTPMHLPAGYVVSGKHPYVIGAALGQGGFGITYIALDMNTNERVAIKEYFPTFCCSRTSGTVSAYPNQDDVFLKGRARFLDEAQVLKSLSDLKSIVNVLDFFEFGNSAYLVMEFLEGCSLKEYVAKNGKFPAQKFFRQIQPLMEDLERMHQRGVIHRDIAPDNIILLPDGQMKLIDFGAARSFVGDKSMTVVVKKGFAPVEQYLTKGATASTDVYALAATIYYCITGTVPLDSAERQYDDISLPSPTSLGADITPAQENALDKALEIQQKTRTQSIQEFLDNLSLATEQKWEHPEKNNQAFQETGARVFNRIVLPSDTLPKKDSPDIGISKNNRQHKGRKLPLEIIIPGIVLLVLLLYVIILSPDTNSGKYIRARTYLSHEQFSEASVLFAELEDYKDSQSLWEEAAYAEAEGLLAEKKYEEAAQLFAELGDYKDSHSLWELCIYSEAELLLAESKYEEVLKKASLIPTYEKTPDLINECLYQRGSKLLQKKQYESAYADLSQIPDDYKQTSIFLRELKLDWGTQILDNADLSSARKYESTVLLTASESNVLYNYIIDKDFYDASSRASDYDFQTRRCMLNTLVGEYPLKESLCELFEEFSKTNSDTFIKNNHKLIAELWDVPVMQNIIREDWNVCIWMLGKWKTKNGLYIRFYEKDNDTSIWSSHTLPWVKKPAGTKYWNIENMVYMWADEQLNKLANVYRFELTGPDTMEVYCYKDKKTYTVVRSK